MRFEIENGVPYLVMQGMAYPVSYENDIITWDTNGRETSLDGRYTFAEVKAKLGDRYVTEEKPKRGKKKQGV